ncbi:unnamed protein product [Mytilus coruscus]|uniref:Uncharacterized protein n=1 Tax=Mytilus coruscus TaxID=42192 RepID=A0A6J8F0K2_MYTCO|nr:unnamed protein product [Mytilus coruscus]
MAATANAMTTQLTTPQNDFTIYGAYSAAHQALYGQGIHDSPYSPSTVPIQMQAPHPTPSQENNALRERVVESQTRSMRDNLIFKGIADVENYNELENTEAKVKEFMGEVLKIKDNINFHVVHRFKPKTDGTPRSIVAKFERRKDRDRVLAIARDKLRENPRYSVYEQFPFEVADRQGQLIPILKDARSKNHHAVLRDDKLYIDHKGVGDDKGVGARTCKDISVVDYLILSSQLFPLLKKFAIAEFELLFSDCHSVLCFEFQASLLTHIRGKLDDLNDTNQTFVKWNSNRSSEFVNCIQTDSEAILVDVLNSIENLSSCDEVCQSDIDVIVD